MGSPVRNCAKRGNRMAMKLTRILTGLFLLVSVCLAGCADTNTEALPVTQYPAYSNNDFMKKGFIYDPITKLVWLQNADCFSFRSWSTATRQTTTLKDDGGQLCGLYDGSISGDWRLPTKDELSVFVDHGYDYAALNNYGFISVKSDAAYWSSTSDTANAWDVHMGTFAKTSTNKAVANHFWPVRKLFKDNGDGTITDTVNNLVWLKNANCFVETLNWDDAMTAASGLSSGRCGLTDGSSAGDWRLPAIDEIAKFFPMGYRNDALNAAGFTSVVGSVYLSSTTYGTRSNPVIPELEWVVDMERGVSGNYDKKLNKGYVWPVRTLK